MIDNKLEKALQWAIKKAEGAATYNMAAPYAGFSGYPGNINTVNPPGESYVCASFVWYAFTEGGYDIGSATAAVGETEERYLCARLKKAGFSKKQFSLDTVRRGDILIRLGKHAEIALGNGQMVGAHKHYTDNPKKDISVTTLSTNWDFLFRPPSQPLKWIERADDNKIVYLSETEKENNVLCFLSDAKAFGWSDVSIAGMLGCIEHESGINPGQQGLGEKYGWPGYRHLPDEYGIGLSMWTFALHKKMVEFVSGKYGRWYSGKGQMEFLKQELDTRTTKATSARLVFIPEDLRHKTGKAFAECEDPRWTVEMATAWFLACYTAGVGTSDYRKYWDTWFPKRYETAIKWYEFIINAPYIPVDPDDPTEKKKNKIVYWATMWR